MKLKKWKYKVVYPNGEIDYCKTLFRAGICACFHMKSYGEIVIYDKENKKVWNKWRWK